MIVDVNIQISNDEGIPVQNFSKRFDGRFEGTRIYPGDCNSIKSFEEFLAEYLSASGRTYRENLLSDKSFESAYNYRSESIHDDVYSAYDATSTSESLEYYIKLGNGQSITGTIPIKRLAYLSEMGDNAEKDAMNHNTKSIKETVMLEGINENSKKAVKLVSVLLENAIEKYEANFYHTPNELTEEFAG